MSDSDETQLSASNLAIKVLVDRRDELEVENVKLKELLEKASMRIDFSLNAVSMAGTRRILTRR